jgi:soluble lytic murein transglycosylase-like protein
MQLCGVTRSLLPAALCCLYFAVPLPGNCQVYVGSAVAGGAVTLSNFQSSEAPELLLPALIEVIPVTPGAAKAETRLVASIPAKAERFRGLIESVAGTMNVAPRLIHAVISAESNYDPKAVSPRGAIGLMQLMPATARRFGVNDAFVEKDNLLAGASYLKWLMGYFGGDVELVLAAYNAGEQAVVKAGRKVPPYPETQAYVRRIMADLYSTGALPL